MHNQVLQKYYSNSQNNLIESRLLSIEQTIREIIKKNMQLESNHKILQGKQEHVEGIIEHIKTRLQSLNEFKSFNRNGLNDITAHENLKNLSSNQKNYNVNSSSEQNYSLKNNSSQTLQFIENLESSTLHNFGLIEMKITNVAQQIQSKCTKMELKMLGMLRQAHALIHSLSSSIEGHQTNISTLDFKLSHLNQSLQERLFKYQRKLNYQAQKFSTNLEQKLQLFRQKSQNQIASILKEIEQINVDKIKQQLIKRIQKFFAKLSEQFQEKMQKMKNQSKLEPTVRPFNSLSSQKFQKEILRKVGSLEQQNNKTLETLKDIKKQLLQKKQNSNSASLSNSKIAKHKAQSNLSSKQYKYQQERFQSLQNSQEDENPWIQKTISSVDKKQQTLLNKQPSDARNLEKKPSQNEFSRQNRFGVKNRVLQSQAIKPQQQEQKYVRGIAGLRSLKKKQQQKYSPLTKKNIIPEANIYQQVSMGSRQNRLRPLHGPKDNIQQGLPKKSLPPLNSDGRLNKNKPMLQRQPQSRNQKYVQTQIKSQQSQEQEQFYIDNQGFLIDNDGNRLLNEQGDEIQLSVDELERLRQLNDEQGNQEQE